MKSLHLYQVILILLCGALAVAQETTHDIQGHAHNDYLHDEPFLDAFSLEFRMLEIDVIPSRKGLVISHLPFKWKSKGTLEELYFGPKVIDALNTMAEGESMTYLIDIKSRPYGCLKKLRDLKTRYASLIYDKCTHPAGKIKLVLSGKVPLKHLTEADLCFLFIDTRPYQKYSSRIQGNIAFCSYSFRKIKRRYGEEWQSELHGLTERLGQQGLRFRLWGIPQDDDIWLDLIDCGIRIINVDDLLLYRQYCKSLE